MSAVDFRSDSKTENTDTVNGSNTVEPLHGRNLCNKCQYMLEHWHLRKPSETVLIGDHYSLSDMLESRDRGCPLCNCFLHSAEGVLQLQADPSIEDEVLDHQIVDAPGKVSIGGVDLSDLYRLEIQFPHASTNYPRVRRGIDMNIVNGAQNVTTHRIPCNTDSKESWQSALNWLQRCLRTHSDCEIEVLDRVLPTRLIEIDSENDSTRLRSSADLPTSTQYTTLSHCWGNANFETLRTSNMAAMMVEIPSSALSTSFLDAIQVTRRLGYKYLWIDSICIIQDDSQDWAQESASMSNVYAGSVLNISAAGAPDGRTGCFFMRDHQDSPGYEFLAKDEGSETPSVWLCSPMYHFKSTMDELIISSRAWTLQERLLSPRTLYFGQEQLLWECRRSVACEQFSDHLYQMRTLPSVLIPYGDRNIAGLLFLWYDLVVSNFSRRTLTYRSDKLVAIAGVARVLAAQYGTAYIAGMWKAQLELQLVWLCRFGVKPRAVCQEPTWSWASNDGIVWWDICLDSTATLFLTVESATTQSIDPFGRVTGGVLHLKCWPLVQLPTVRPENVVWYSLKISNHNVRRFRLNCQDRDLSFITFWPDTDPHELDGSLYLLRVCQSSMLYGLVLKLSSINTFRRVACFQIPSWGIEQWSDLQFGDGFRQYTGSSPVHHDTEGNELCVINLV